MRNTVRIAKKAEERATVGPAHSSADITKRGKVIELNTCAAIRTAFKRFTKSAENPTFPQQESITVNRTEVT